MKRLSRISLAAGLITLALPAVASAHVAGVEYAFPIPVWLYALAGGIAVLVSAPAAAFAVRAGRERVSRDIYPVLGRLRLGALTLGLASLLLIDAIVGGLFGEPVSFTANPAPLIIWVDFWVGLGIVSALLGNAWDFISPLSAVARALDRSLARRGKAARPFPPWLGVWPSVVLLVFWVFAELVWNDGARGRPLALLVVTYVIVQLVGAAVFGAEMWLSRAELFTVVARTFGRFAPFELFVRDHGQPCAAGRCEEAERINCPACWLASAQEKRGVRLRPYGAGIRREPHLGPGGGAFVVVMLAAVVYDGSRATTIYAHLVDTLWGNGDPFSERIGVATLLMAFIVFTLAFVLACALVSLREHGSALEIAQRYAPTLIPIAAVYFISHYFLYWLYYGQLTFGTAVDPFEREWFPDYLPWSGVPGVIVWYLQVALILWGHIVAVIEAHRVSITHHRTARRALGAQLPLVVLMVAYTFTGLWVLGQTLRAQ